MSVTEVRLGISLEVDHHIWQNCTDLAEPLRQQMASGKYDEMSVLPIPLTINEWRLENRSARKRAQRAANRGYAAGPLAREEWQDDIYRINTSAKYRQGRPMSNGYLVPPQDTPLPHYPCPRHAIRTQGVWTGSGHLVGYITLIRAGELALVSQLLGHDSFLKDDIMFLLFQSVLLREIEADPAALMVYNRHDSGTPGLVEFKERLGFQAMPVEWLP